MFLFLIFPLSLPLFFSPSLFLPLTYAQILSYTPSTHKSFLFFPSLPFDRSPSVYSLSYLPFSFNELSPISYHFTPLILIYLHFSFFLLRRYTLNTIFFSLLPFLPPSFNPSWSYYHTHPFSFFHSLISPDHYSSTTPSSFPAIFPLIPSLLQPPLTS